MAKFRKPAAIKRKKAAGGCQGCRKKAVPKSMIGKKK